MSITSEIQRIQGNISDAYNACATKNATMPAVQNSSYLADTINSIAGGGGEDSLFARYEVVRYENGTNVVNPLNTSATSFFQNITSVSTYSGWVNVCGAFEGAFHNCYGLRGSINFCNLYDYYGVDDKAFTRAFENCYNVVGEVNFCKLSKVHNDAFCNAFRNCNRITGANFANLQNVSGSMSSFSYAFSGCSNLAYVKLGNGAYISGVTTTVGDGTFAWAFSNCPKLVDVDINLSDIVSNSAFYQTFNSCGMNNVIFNVSTIQANKALQLCFRNCVNLKNLYFPQLTTIYNDSLWAMLQMCNDVTVHFRQDRESQWSSLPNFVSGFSGTNTTVLFDL